MKYYLYIIETFSNTLYCGIAKNPLSRFEVHSKGKGAKYTKIHKPKEIVYLKECKDKQEALKEEYRTKKTLTRSEKLELIKKEQENTKLLISKLKSSSLI